MEVRKEKAFAKINLFLDIQGRWRNGYHDLVTIMQTVTLHDEVEISLHFGDEIILEVINSEVDIPKEQNLAYIAAQKFYESLDFKPCLPKIVIKKNIPIGAGLAGGSADAAAVLRGLNYLIGKPFTTDQLSEIGLTIGSDVPFCIVGGVQLCTGRGIVFDSLYGLDHYYLLIAKGEDKISTKEQYRKLDLKYDNFKDHKIREDYHLMYCDFLGKRCTPAMHRMYNIFEELYDENSSVAKIKEIMNKHDCRFSMLCGSGPSVFGVFSHGYRVEDAQEELLKNGIKSYVCYPINLEQEYIFDGVKYY